MTMPVSEGRTFAYCPPEVLKQSSLNRKSNPSLDMWSLGVILYIMLVGAHPFDLQGDATDQEVTQRILNKFPLPLQNHPFAQHLSDSACELITKLLAHDEKDRMTSHELLQHPWVKGITASTQTIQNSDKKLSKFKKIKSQLEQKVFEDFFESSDGDAKMSLLERSFRNLDKGSKGFVTADDVLGDTDTNDKNDTDDPEEALSLSAFSEFLSQSMKNEYYPKGAIIFQEGDKGEDMMFINSGVVEVSNQAGFRTTLKQGDFAGEGALLSNKPRSATMKCLTPVHAIKITKEYFDKYLQQSNSGLNLKMLERDKDRETSRVLFSAFSNLLRKEMKNSLYNEGDVIFREGDLGDDMIFINKGVVQVTNQDGFSATLKQGDFVGEGALLSNKPRSGTVTCLTPVEGMKITKEYFDKYLAESGGGIRLTMRQKEKDRDLGRSKMVLRNQKSLRSLHIQGGDYLFKEGDTTKSLFIMEQGIAKILAGGHVVLTINPGDICGEDSVILNRPSNASARCASGICKLLEISTEDFKDLAQTSSTGFKESIRQECLLREFQKAVVFQIKKDFPSTPKALREAFQAVTAQECISLDVTRILLRNMNPGIPEEEVQGVFDALDLDGKGYVGFETFLQIFDSNKPN